MKRLFTFIFISLLAVLFSCHDEEADNSENPVPDYLTATGFTEVETLIDDRDYEFGFSFIPQVDGEMKAMVVKIPDEMIEIRVVLWNVATAKAELTAFFPMKAKTTRVYNFGPWPLKKDKEYMISFQTDDYYKRTRPDGGDATYPIAAGNFVITGYKYRSVGPDELLPVMPDISANDFYAGELSFKFVANQ